MELDKKDIIKFDKDLFQNKSIQTKDENFQKLMFLYSSAIKELEVKINIIKEQFKYFYNYNLINNITTRIKEPKSIIKKMKRKNYTLTYKDMVEKINDIAGIRIVCPLKQDIFIVKEMIKSFSNCKIIKEKDYITNPKKSGYSSYHLIVETPVNLGQHVVPVKVEIQICTMAMDFWSNLEHEVKYKPTKKVPKKISKELVSCAQLINKLDNKMMNIYNT